MYLAVRFHMSKNIGSVTLRKKLILSFQIGFHPHAQVIYLLVFV